MIQPCLLLSLVAGLAGCHLALPYQSGAAGDRVGHDLAPSDAPRLDIGQRDFGPPRPDSGPHVLFRDNFAEAAVAAAWKLWRVEFAIQNGRLTALPAPRRGFDWGQYAGGRSATVMTHVGDTTWKDYRLTFTFQNTAVDPAHNRYNVPTCHASLDIRFRAKSAHENWNDPSESYYALSLGTRTCPTTGCPGCSSRQGAWALLRYNDYYVVGVGWTDVISGSRLPLAEGTSASIQDGPNTVVVEVTGQAPTNITVLVNGTPLVTYHDSGTTPRLGPILHGGIGVAWGWESLGWIDDVTVEPL